MKKNNNYGLSFNRYFANDLDAYIPEFWANEALVLLEENMVAANLVHRDFEDELQNYGDTVNIKKPGTLQAKRKVDCEDVTIQDLSATSTSVVLNQQVHTSFLICDGDMSKSSTDLIEEFLRPAVLAQARWVDKLVLSQYAQFLPYSTGALLGLTSSNAKDFLLDTRKVMNDKLIPFDSRLGILNSATETDLLKLDIFTHADKVGDEGTALREAWLGRKFGIDLWMSQNMPTVAAGNTSVTGAINNAAGYAIGTTSLTVDGFSAAIANGSWVVVDGLPYRVVSTTGGSTPTVIVVSPALTRAVADNAVVRVYTPAAVNLTGGYPAGHLKEIVIDGTSVAPRVGQAITFGANTTGAIYTVLEATLTTILLDRPLEAALLDDAQVNLGPAGNFNFFFTRNAIALVVRPLAAPKAGAGALATTISTESMTMRVTIAYLPLKQAHLVTLDFLAGIKVLDPTLGLVMGG